MLAAWYKKFGTANEVLEVGDFDEQYPKEGEVKIRIYSSAVNPSDTKKRAGSNLDILKDGLIIPHSDGSGEIIDVGDKSLKHRVGEKVWIFEAQHNRNFGTASEYVCLPTFNAVRMPDSLSYDIGAMIGIPAMTAHRCVHNNKNIEGQYVLITGGAGRVGHYAIQLAKKKGATVITTASNSKSAEQCKNAGADMVFEHPSEEFVNHLLDYTAGQKIDKIIDGDFGINLQYILNILKPNGNITTYASMSKMKPTFPFYQIMNLNINISTVFVYDMPKKAKKDAIKDIASYLESNSLIHRLSRKYPLKNISEAHIKIEDKNTDFGAVIINP